MSGVFPCYKNQFEIADAGSETGYSIADMESFSASFDDGVEEWNPFDMEGWTNRLKTAKSVTISVSGKRNVGDKGNDLVASVAFLNGRDCEKDFKWVFPDGTKVVFKNAVINITALGSSDSTAVAPLEFDVMSNGKPEVTLPETDTTNT